MSAPVLFVNRPILRKSLASLIWLVVALPLAITMLFVLQGAHIGLVGSLAIAGATLGIVGGLTKISSP